MSVSAPRSSSEYSVWIAIGRVCAGEGGQLPGGVAAGPGVADATGGDGVFEGGGDLVERGRGVPRGDAPQVEVVGVEGAQGVVELAEQAAAGAVDAVGVGLGGVDAGAAAEHDRRTRDDVAEHSGEDSLRGAAGVFGGGVDQSAAGVDERDELRGRLVAVGLPAPAAGAQTDPRDPQPAVTRRSLLHRPTGVPITAPA